jgi:peptide/nickel transport system ATP-binding protein
VSFTLERGKTLGVVGESGSGKTILSRSIMGLLPPRNVERTGSVRFEGTEISGYSQSEMRHVWGTEMAMVFQDPMTSLNPVMKIGRQITESLRYHLDMDKDEAKESAERCCARRASPSRAPARGVPPPAVGRHAPARVIAIALACGPKLLFADEPTTALDVTVQAQILDLLDEQQRERFMAMILVTHDLGVVAGRADEIAVMYAGKIVEKAPTRCCSPTMRMPYTEALLRVDPEARAPQPHPARDHRRRPRPGQPAEGLQLRPRCPYAQERCHEEEPPLMEAETPGHLYAVLVPGRHPREGRGPLERNGGRGRPAAVTEVAAARRRQPRRSD